MVKQMTEQEAQILKMFAELSGSREEIIRHSEVLKAQAVLNEQDELDKQGVALVGFKDRYRPVTGQRRNILSNTMGASNIIPKRIQVRESVSLERSAE